jgi:mannose-1-phosphate guanylyltransferase
MLHAVIMAGGSGTRFWPLSRHARPKQLLKLAGERTMIQATVDRLEGLVPHDRTWVVTNRSQAAAIAEQLPQLPPGAILSEPCKRDTAPCIGWAAVELIARDPDPTMLVLPADHVIEPAAVFQQAVAQAARLVDERPERFVTFGVRPTYPAESFGYIERGDALPTTTADDAPAYAVRRFREKPKADVAREYLASGNFYWNAGIFVWRAATVLSALAEREPETYQRLQTIASAHRTAEYEAVLEREFAAIRPKSIDYAVMEHATDVAVIEAPFSWDDVGSWQAIARHHPSDADGNTIVGRHVGLRTQGTIVRSDEQHLVVTVGLKDCLVVHTPDATLVANKHDEESVRQIVKILEDRGWKDVL